MEGSNWCPEVEARPDDPSAAGSSDDWRKQLLPEARQRIVNKIMDTLKRHLPVSGPEGLNELKKTAEQFEEKIYRAAINQSDYLRKLSLKMLSMETKTQGAAAINPSLSNPTIGNQSPSESASGSTGSLRLKRQLLCFLKAQQRRVGSVNGSLLSLAFADNAVERLMWSLASLSNKMSIEATARTLFNVSSTHLASAN